VVLDHETLRRWLIREGLWANPKAGVRHKKLGIAILTAHSPQAKGRVERKHGVFQDRFLKELALQGITSIAEANRLLREGFVEDLNRRFAVPPADPVDAIAPVPRERTWPPSSAGKRAGS